MKRKIYDKLVEWKQQRKGETALMVEGARRVGFSTLTTTEKTKILGWRLIFSLPKARPHLGTTYLL